jgi:hypothetical protein
VPHPGVEAAGLEQVVVPADLGDRAAVGDDDLVGVADGVEPVGDDQDGTAT